MYPHLLFILLVSLFIHSPPPHSPFLFFLDLSLLVYITSHNLSLSLVLTLLLLTIFLSFTQHLFLLHPTPLSHKLLLSHPTFSLSLSNHLPSPLSLSAFPSLTQPSITYSNPFFFLSLFPALLRRSPPHVSHTSSTAPLPYPTLLSDPFPTHHPNPTQPNPSLLPLVRATCQVKAATDQSHRSEIKEQFLTPLTFSPPSPLPPFWFWQHCNLME